MRRLPLFYAVLMAVFLASGCASMKRHAGLSADQLKELGQKALAAHDTGTALKFLTQAEQKEPNDASIQYDLGLAYNQRDLLAQAIEHMQTAIKLKPDYPEAWNTLGSLFATNGQFDLARAAFEKALTDPFYQTPQEPAYNLGQLYQERGDNQRALSYYRKAVKLDPQSAAAWFQIGNILEHSGNIEEARKAYKSAVREAPSMAQGYLRLGILYYRAGNIKESAGYFSLAERFAPESDVAEKAQSYLDKINTAAPVATPRRHYLPSRLNEIENSQNGQPNTAAPSFGGQSAQAPSTTPANTPAVKAPNRWRYVVKIGSFSDRAKAESMKENLCAKGFSALVSHGAGNVFLVELEPVDKFSQAATLETQIAGLTHCSPTIIKIPAR
ncbi:MAG: tetratricopeptide repeat protein [Syntrophobacteraceae bacterium]